MLSPVEQAALDRGQALKRYVRAAAAVNDLFDDKALAQAVEVGRNTIGGWWSGARPEPVTIRRLASVTGLSLSELTDFIHHDGPPPSLPDEVWAAAAAGILEGERRAEERLARRDPDTPSPSLERPPHGSEAGRG